MRRVVPQVVPEVPVPEVHELEWQGEATSTALWDGASPKVVITQDVLTLRL